MVDPIAISIGPIDIRWYGLLAAAGLLIGIVGGLHMAKKKGIDEDDFLSIIIAAIIFGFLGARTYYVLFNLEYYLANPIEIPAVWHGGLAIHGGIIGGGLATYVMCRRYKIDFLTVADIAAPFLILGQAIGRWGNFFNQEAYGYEVDPSVVPWAMYIDGAYRHPTFLYESIWNIGVFVILVLLARKAFLRKGEVAFLYLMLYSVGRFFVEGFRTDSLMFGPLRMAQVTSIVFFLGALAVMFYRRKKYKDDDIEAS